MEHDSSRQAQLKQTSRYWLVFCILLILLIVGLYTGLRFGAISYSHNQLMRTLQQPFVDNSLQDVIIDLRLPRVLAAALVGAAMASAGGMMQGITRNAIADPGLLGINAGAGLALVVAYTLFGSLHYSLILLACMLGSVIATFCVFALAYQPGKGFPPQRLLLAGVMAATFFTALGQAIVLWANLSTRMIGWQAGGLAATNWRMLTIIGPVILLGLVLSRLMAHQLNVISLDQDVASALGQDTQRTRILLLATVLVLSAGAVALVGAIAFIGLIIPHCIALFSPRDFKRTLPMVALGGAVFLIWVDLICRVIQAPQETPMSAIISLVGLPCFLWLVRRNRL